MTQFSHAQGELLAQIRPGVTTPVVLYQNLQLRAEITLIKVSPDETPVQVTLYHDDDGATFDTSTELCKVNYTSVPTQADPARPFFQAQHPGSGIQIKPDGALGVAVSAANQATISVYGITETLADRIRGLE